VTVRRPETDATSERLKQEIEAVSVTPDELGGLNVRPEHRSEWIAAMRSPGEASARLRQARSTRRPSRRASRPAG
jgi:hypothetical protein